MTTAPATAAQSSFDVRPLGRLFWKEYRQQRTLWVAMLVVGMTLQLIVRIVAAVFASDVMARDALLVLWAIPFYPTAFFLIGSTAMLFALEREERTSDWLLNLSAPPWATLLAKYGFTVTSTTCLALALWLWAAVLSVGSGLDFGSFTFGSFTSRHASFGWALMAMLGFVSLFGAGFLLWGTLGSLTSRRVVTAVPTGLGWWIAIYLVPMVTVIYLSWLRYGRMHHDGEIYFQSLFPSIGAVCFLGTAALDVYLGLRWCRGQYLDASWLDNLNERWSPRLTWRRVGASRVPAAVESELSGWRTWQRLVWQERHRESLHIGLLVIVCAIGVLLALYSLGPGFEDGALTFIVTPFIAALPCAMGVIGFRFDAGGQQLRFLANRGTSPTMIWLAKQVVWLPRAFWIPAVCWAVTCLAEWVFIPWANTPFTNTHSIDGLRHPVVEYSYSGRGQFWEVVWFALMSYAAGQAAAMLFRRMILAIGAGLMATILLIYWQVLVVSVPLPRWWAVGGIAVWLLCLTGWYSRHWLIERRSWSVLKRLAVGLTLPPLLLLLFGAALFRWLEFPGLGPSSRPLMTLLYPREAERRDRVLGLYGVGQDGQLNEIRAAVKQVTEPTSPESRAVQYALVSASRAYRPLSQIRVSPELVASLPADASREEQDRAARERFWSFNDKALAVIMEVLSDELPASYRTQRTGHPVEDATPNPELLHDAGRLSLDQGDPRQALRYFMAGLRLARCSASQGQFWYWVGGRESQAEILQSLVLWSNHEGVTRVMLMEAIEQTREELARYPTLRETSAAEFVLGFQREKWLRLQMESEESASLYVAKSVVVALIPHEFARQRRINEQVLFWRWHLLRSLETQTQHSLFNPRQQLVAWGEEARRSGRPDHDWMYLLLYPSVICRFGNELGCIFTSYEAVNRQALLALAIALWEKDHGGALPDSLEDLAAYCIIDGPKDPARVLPVMALNDPWTGAMFAYSTAGRPLANDGHVLPVVILSSEGPNLSGHQPRAVVKASGQGIVFANAPATEAVMVESLGGWLSLRLPPKLQR